MKEKNTAPQKEEKFRVKEEHGLIEKINIFSRNIEVVREYLYLVNPVVRETLEQELKKVNPLIEKLALGAKKADRKRDGKKKIEALFSEIEDLNDFTSTLKKFSTRAHISSHLLETSLVSLVSHTEIFFSEILHEQYSQYPEAIVDSDEKRFSFKDLKKFKSLEDAQTSLIADAVEKVLRDNFDRWIHHLKSRMKLECVFIEENLHQIKEIFLRRNLFVHNGGVVNSIYLSGVSSSPFKEGDRIKIDIKYLERSFDLIQAAFCLVAYELLSRRYIKQSEKMDEFFEGVNESIVSYISSKRYFVAEHIALFASKALASKNQNKLIFKINYWQAVKWQGRLSEVHDDIVNVDISGMVKSFALAKYALLDENDAFFKLLPEVLKKKEISLDNLMEWPLFNSIRQDERMTQYSHKAQPAKLASKKSIKLHKRKAKKKLFDLVRQDSNSAVTGLRLQ
ncbi:MAG: hypothetical protein ACK4PK_03545 [Alphaproteobacteria bacterium]